MKQLITALTAALTLTSALAGNTAAQPKTIGIIIPMALPAMTQIVDGFETQVRQNYQGPVKFIVENAQGDTSIQRAILQELEQNNQVNLIAPIGTDATEMALRMIHDKPIVAIAAEMPNGQHFANATNVLDEVSVAKQVEYIHQTMPQLKKLTLIYSADQRLFEDVKSVEAAGKANNIAVQTLMIEQLPDLYTVRQHIASDSQAIFILKDEMVVSGIKTLAQQAKQQHIPVIASDDGSVTNGAAFALGVRETDIGIDSGKAAVKILNGTPAGSIPQYIMTQYSVFINAAAAKQQGVDAATLKQVAKKLNYNVVDLG